MNPVQFQGFHAISARHGSLEDFLNLSRHLFELISPSSGDSFQRSRNLTTAITTGDGKTETDEAIFNLVKVFKAKGLPIVHFFDENNLGFGPIKEFLRDPEPEESPLIQKFAPTRFYQKANQCLDAVEILDQAVNEFNT